MITAPINTLGFKAGLPVRFGGGVLVEKAYQIIPWDPGTQLDPTVGRVQLVVKGVSNPGKENWLGLVYSLRGARLLEFLCIVPCTCTPLISEKFS